MNTNTRRRIRSGIPLFLVVWLCACAPLSPDTDFSTGAEDAADVGNESIFLEKISEEVGEELTSTEEISLKVENESTLANGESLETEGDSVLSREAPPEVDCDFIPLEKVVLGAAPDGRVLPPFEESEVSANRMEFYSIKLRPVVRDRETHETGIIDYEIIYYENTANYIFKPYTTEKTAAFYAAVSDFGYEQTGWEVRVSYRFNFSRPRRWVYSTDEKETCQEYLSQPRDPYQLTTFTYLTDLPSDPKKIYTTSFSGTVYYDDKNNQGNDKIFKATVTFNVEENSR